MIIKRAIVLLKIFAPGLFCILFASCKNDLPDNRLIITEFAITNQDTDLAAGGTFRYLAGARISAIYQGSPESFRVLTGDFYSACSPDISYDGKYMLFAGQQKENDLWQIWEMDLNKMKSRKVTSLNENCIDPVYLPGGRLAFSKMTKNDTVKAGHPLFTSNLNGSNVRQITFHPNDNFATAVLKDGRLLTVSRQLLPAKNEQILMVVRPDGTKAYMFYNGNGTNILIGRARETSDGRILFIEADRNNEPAGDVVSISYNWPLYSKVNLTVGINLRFNAVLPLQSGKLLVSFRNPEEEAYALCEFDPETKSFDQTIYSSAEYIITDIVIASNSERPKKLPSEVDMQVKTGLLLCQDINVTGVPPGLNNPGGSELDMIEVMGIDSTYGKVTVEEDGSFYLKVIADKPFQIRALDKEGRVVYGPCTWLWLRPNERRGCVGCHEDPEIVPLNRVPLAVKKQPVIIPVHITEVREKTVELE